MLRNYLFIMIHDAKVGLVHGFHFMFKQLFHRPKPEKKIVKPIEQPVVDTRKLSEPAPKAKLLPQRKLSLTMSITYEFLET